MACAKCNLSEPDDTDGAANPCPANRLSTAAGPHECYERVYLMTGTEEALPCSRRNSLHLGTLVREYLEPSFILTRKSTSLNINDAADRENRSFHELQAVVEDMAHDMHAGLRKEVLKACQQARASLSSYSLPFVSVSNQDQMQGIVLRHLRKIGFNAGICKTKRLEAAIVHNLNSHLFPEEYAYLDVVVASARDEEGEQSSIEDGRALIDLRFRSGFEIARPSPAYAELLTVVPSCFVGSARVLHEIIRLLSEAMKTSLAGHGMPLPPWRTLPFLHSRWLSPHYSRACSPTNPKRPSELPASRVAPAGHHPTSAMTKHLLTDRNSIPPPASTTYLRPTKLGPAHLPQKPPPQELWPLPPRIQRAQSLKKARKLVGALTLELQRASIAGSARSLPVASLHLRI